MISAFLFPPSCFLVKSITPSKFNYCSITVIVCRFLHRLNKDDLPVTDSLIENIMWGGFSSTLKEAHILFAFTNCRCIYSVDFSESKPDKKLLMPAAGDDCEEGHTLVLTFAGHEGHTVMGETSDVICQHW